MRVLPRVRIFLDRLEHSLRGEQRHRSCVSCEFVLDGYTNFLTQRLGHLGHGRDVSDASHRRAAPGKLVGERREPGLDLTHQRALNLPDPRAALVQLPGGLLEAGEDLPGDVARRVRPAPPVVLGAIHVAGAEPLDVHDARGDLIHGNLVAGADHAGDDLEFLQPRGRGVVGDGEVAARAVRQQLHGITQPRGCRVRIVIRRSIRRRVRVHLGRRVGCVRLTGGCVRLTGGCVRLTGGCLRLTGGCLRLTGGCLRLTAAVPAVGSAVPTAARSRRRRGLRVPVAGRSTARLARLPLRTVGYDVRGLVIAVRAVRLVPFPTSGRSPRLCGLV